VGDYRNENHTEVLGALIMYPISGKKWESRVPALLHLWCPKKKWGHAFN